MSSLHPVVGAGGAIGWAVAEELHTRELPVAAAGHGSGGSGGRAPRGSPGDGRDAFASRTPGVVPTNYDVGLVEMVRSFKEAAQ